MNLEKWALFEKRLVEFKRMRKAEVMDIAQRELGFTEQEAKDAVTSMERLLDVHFHFEDEDPDTAQDA